MTNNTVACRPTPCEVPDNDQGSGLFEFLALAGGFTRYATEWYTERENHYYRAFKTVDPLAPKALSPTRSKGEQNLNGFFDQLTADAEADD